MRTGICDAPLNHVDIAPTTLGLCGIPVPEAMVGYDYSAHCKRPDAPEYSGPPRPEREPRSAYLQQVTPKLMRHTVNRPWRAVVTRDGWKYACTPGHDWLLFDTAEDPCEQANYVYDRTFQPQKERCHRLLAGLDRRHRRPLPPCRRSPWTATPDGGGRAGAAKLAACLLSR